MKITILHHVVAATASASYATIDVFDCTDEGPPERYMLVCARNGETYYSELFKQSRTAAAAWLDAITRAENEAE